VNFVSLRKLSLEFAISIVVIGIGHSSLNLEVVHDLAQGLRVLLTPCKVKVSADRLDSIIIYLFISIHIIIHSRLNLQLVEHLGVKSYLCIKKVWEAASLASVLL
jgi:hypothetical protein